MCDCPVYNECKWSREGLPSEFRMLVVELKGLQLEVLPLHTLTLYPYSFPFGMVLYTDGYGWVGEKGGREEGMDGKRWEGARKKKEEEAG